MDVKVVPQYKTFEDWQFFFVNGANIGVTIEPAIGECVEADDVGYSVTLKEGADVLRSSYYVLLRNMTHFTTRARRVEQLDPKDTPVAKHLARLAKTGSGRRLPSTTQE